MCTFNVGSPVLVRKHSPSTPMKSPMIEQLENFHRLRAEFLRLDVNLDPPGRVAQIEEMTFAHVAMRGDAAGRAQGFAFLKFFAHLRDRAAGLKRGAEGRDAARPQLFQLGATLRDQFVFVVHCKKATVNRKYLI